MRREKRPLKRLLLLVASGASSLFLAACYGVPMMYQNLRASVRIRAVTADDSGIEYIKVTAPWLDSALRTDGNGYALLPTDGLGVGLAYGTILLSDDDGPAHLGTFAPKSASLNLSDELTTIVLEPAR
jgi:hypothetical protein